MQKLQKVPTIFYLLQCMFCSTCSDGFTGTNFLVWCVKVGKKVCQNGQNIETNKMPNTDKNKLILKNIDNINIFYSECCKTGMLLKKSISKYFILWEHCVFGLKLLLRIISLSCVSGTNIISCILSWRIAGHKII